MFRHSGWRLKGHGNGDVFQSFVSSQVVEGRREMSNKTCYETLSLLF
ncbi:MAG: hypothetical protein ACI90V_005806, partial [Bacillariaceae sp.]